MSDIDLAALNTSEDDSRKYVGVEDNTKSQIKDMILEAFSLLGGPSADIFKTKNIRELLQNIDTALGSKHLNVSNILQINSTRSKAKKDKVTESSSLSDLNTAILNGKPETLGNAFFFRGLILLSLESYTSASHNFEEALKCNVDGKEAYRVHHKAAQSYLKLKKYSKSREHLRAAIGCLPSAKLPEKRKKEYRSILTDSEEKIAKKKDSHPKETDLAKLLLKTRHTKDPRLCGEVVVLHTHHQGRFLTAADNIPTGTVIGVDEGIAPFLNPDDKENSGKYCSECLLPVSSSPFPCYECTRTVFCSPLCRQQASQSSHSVTCQLAIPAIRERDNKAWTRVFSALPILTSQTAQYWIQHRDRLIVQGREKSCDEEVTDRYTHLFAMETHEDDISQEMRAKHAVVSLFLIRCLRKTTYLAGVKVKEKGLSQDELTIGEFLFRIRLIIESNCYPVWGVEQDTTTGEVSIENIGSGVYPSLGSCLNNSCNPNTIRCNIGNTTIIVASTNIKKGEEICDNYCIHFSELPGPERRVWLKENFQFDCCCVACSENWGTYDQLSCKLPVPLQKKLLPLENKIQQELSNEEIDRAILHQCEEIRIVEEALPQPHGVYVGMRNSFQNYWWTKIAKMITLNLS